MGVKDYLASLWIRRRVYRRAAVLLVAVLAVLLLALPILAAGEPVGTARPAPIATPGYGHILLPGDDNLAGVYILCDPPAHLVFHSFGPGSGRVDCTEEE